MTPTSTKNVQKAIPYLPALLGSLILALILAACDSGNPIVSNPRPSSSPSASSQSVSPYIFGTNLSIHDANDQILTSVDARNLLQQLHPRIIRMPTRSELPQSVYTQLFQIIKGMGATPLIILAGRDINPDALAFDKQIINDANSVFGNDLVYYEYGNEEDLQGIDVQTYTNSWNALIPELKSTVKNAQFIGPVNFKYSSKYLNTFLKQANPRPDAISWHEYTCEDKSAPNECLANIDDWSFHIRDARSVMQNAIKTELPIMITEWNFAPDAQNNSGKNLDNNFVAAWTNKALQTLAANRIFASMQYSATNTAIPLINSSNAITAQGTAFQSQYQQIIINGQQPVATVPPGQPTQTPGTPTTAPQGAALFSFEDGSTDGWAIHSNGISNLQNSATLAQDGKHALKMTLSNTSKQDFPYISVSGTRLVPAPQPGQTVTAYLYIASNAVSVQAKAFIVDDKFTWHIGQPTTLQPGQWTRITVTVPQNFSGPPTQLGVQFNSSTGGAASDISLDNISWQ